MKTNLAKLRENDVNKLNVALPIYTVANIISVVGCASYLYNVVNLIIDNLQSFLVLCSLTVSVSIVISTRSDYLDAFLGFSRKTIDFEHE